MDRFWYRGFDVYIEYGYAQGRIITISDGYRYDIEFDTIPEAMQYIDSIVESRKGAER